MLARNDSLKGRPLRPATLASLKELAARGVEFVVGDIPGVDEPFVRALEDLGASFTIYHGGKAPRFQAKAPVRARKRRPAPAPVEPPQSSMADRRRAAPNVAPGTPVPAPSAPRNLYGHAKAQQLARAWRQLLGLKGTYEAVLTEAQEKALAQPAVTDAQHEAVHTVARQVASQVIQEHLAKADTATRQAIEQAWTEAGVTDTTRESWLAERISEVLLYDAQMQQLYADRGANLLFKWLRGVGLKLLQLVKAVRARLGFTEPAPSAAVAQFVRALVDQQRTQMAESLGVSPLTTAELQNATHALLGEKPVPFGAIKQMLGSRAHPFYRPWLQALEHVVEVTKESPEIRIKASRVLRQAIGQIDPAWATQDQATRRRLRQRKFDRLPSLAGLQQASPEAADAVRKVLDALYASEDALDRAGSLQRAALDTQEMTPQRATLAELLNETRQERLQDRRLRRAFLGALRRPHIRGSEDRLAARGFTEAARWFDALAPTENTPERSLMRAKFLAKYDTMSKEMADFERRPAGREAAVLHTVWLALGLAQDEMPALVPTGEAWAEFGVQFDPRNTDVVAEVFGGVADYVARERLFERLPARHRDALVEAYLKNPGKQDIQEWLSEHLVRALESDPVLYQTVLLAEAAPGARLGYARHTTQHLLANALTYDGAPVHPAVRAALRYRLGNRYGTEATTKAEQVLLGTGDPSNLWYLLAQGVHLVDGELRVDPEARARAQALIRASSHVRVQAERGPVDVMWEALGDEGFQRLAAMAPEIRKGKLPGPQSRARQTLEGRNLLQVATRALNGYYTRLAQYEDALDELSPHFEALLDTARTLKKMPSLTTKQMIQLLLQWRDDLHRAPREVAPTTTEALPGEELADENTPSYTETGVEDEATWMEQEMLYAVETGAIHDQVDGPDIGTEAEITDALGYEHNKEQEARPTILRQGLALFTEYTPRKQPKPGKTYDSDYVRPRARHYFKPITIRDRFAVGTELNSNDATSIDSPIAIDSKVGVSEPFAADLGHELFRQLPAETQAMLFERAQLLGRMGVEAEYRLARHKGEREVRYLDETLHLTDLSAIHTETMANGRMATDLLLLDAVNRKLEKARAEARNIPKDAQGNRVVNFRVLAALDHPLLARIEAVMRQVLPLDDLRHQWADQRGWAPGLDARGRSKMPAELRQAVETAAGKLRTAIEEDAELKSLVTESGQAQRLLAAAMGYGPDLFSNRLPPKNAEYDAAYLDQLEQPDVPGYQRTTQPESRLDIDMERAEQLGLDRDPIVKARRLRLFDRREELKAGRPDAVHRALDFMLRAYLDSYDPRTGTFDAGARATVTADALVALGKDTLTGLEGSPDVYFNRVDKLARGIDLAGRMATPWAPTESTPHLNPDLVLFRKWIRYKEPVDGREGEFQNHTVAQELAKGANAQQMLETMGELDQDVQLTILQLERIMERVRTGELQLGEQALNDQGQPLWTYRGVLPDEVQQWIDSVDKPSRFDAQPKVEHPGEHDRPAAMDPKRKQFGWMNRFANRQGGKAAPTIQRSAIIPAFRAFTGKGGKKYTARMGTLVEEVQNEVYTARPHTHLDDFIWVQTRLTGLRARISQLRDDAKAILTDQRSMGGSELNQFATFEEEFSDLMAWLDQMEIGNHQARAQTELQLINPDLGSEGKKWDADLKAYQREGYTTLETEQGESRRLYLLREGDIAPEYPLPVEQAPVPALEDVAPVTLASVAEEKAQAEKVAARVEQARIVREQKPLYLNFTPNEAATPWTWSGDPSTPVGGQPRPVTSRAPSTLTTSPQAALLSLVPAHAFSEEVALVNQAVQKLGLDSKAMKVTFVDLEALQNSKDKIADLEKLGLAGLAEQIWNHGFMEPFFTILKDGHAHIILMNGRFVDGKFQKVTDAELQDALAHELGHVFFHQRMSAALKDQKARAELVKLLEDRLPLGYTDLHIEEGIAEVIRGWLRGETTPTRPGNLTLVGKLTQGLIKGLRALLGLRPTSQITLDQLLIHARGRARDAAGVRYFSGRQLLTDAGRLGSTSAKGTWETMKALYDTVIRTSHSWLRSQRTVTGETIPALGLLADILRWTSGVAPKTQMLGGQLFDFDSTTSDSYHQSYEAALTRYFARWGTRIERELHPLTLEQQRQAVADYVNGVETEHAQMFDKLFQDMGTYFGPVLKRHEGAKALPRIFDQKVLQEKREEFLALMQSKGMSQIEAEQLHARLSREQGTDYRADTGQFFAPHFQRARQGDALDLILDKDLLPYLLVATQPQAALWQYTHQMVKRTEFERRFGGWVERGESPALNDAVLPRLLSPNEVGRVEHYKSTESGYPLYRITRIVNGKPKTIKVNWDHTAKFRHLRAMAAKQGATQAQLNQVTRIMEAELGRYGADFSPRLRTLQSAMVAGMNWAVLPLSLFAQTTDLALPLLRSNGNFKLAWKGMKLALKALKEKEGNGLYVAARANGILAGNLRDYFASAYLDTPFIGTAAQKMNNTLFRLNGMEHATEFVRMYAFALGHEWIQELAGKQTDEADAQLTQLGLHRADVLAWQQHQQLDTGTGTPSAGVERVQQALNLFVEQSMFRPSASQRPAWASHPAAMLVWYLKSYIWSYADTILGRAWREFQRQDDWGKKAMVASMPFLFMLPLAALGLLLRDELRDSLLLPWRKSKVPAEDDSTLYMARLVSRTGLFGPMQMLLDAGRASEYGNPYYLSLIGPFATMPDQLIRGVASSADTGKALTDALLRLTPVLGALPQERKALLETVY